MKKLIITFLLFAISNFCYSNTISKKELECLSKNVYYEARHLSLQGQIAVIFVVKNRINSKKYPNTICEVVWQPKQFSWTHDGKSDIPYEREIYKLITLLSKVVWKDLESLEDITLGATHYYAAWSKEPCWLADMKYLIQIDEHKFYKEYKSTGKCRRK